MNPFHNCHNCAHNMTEVLGEFDCAIPFETAEEAALSALSQGQLCKNFVKAPEKRGHDEASCPRFSVHVGGAAAGEAFSKTTGAISFN